MGEMKMYFVYKDVRTFEFKTNYKEALELLEIYIQKDIEEYLPDELNSFKLLSGEVPFIAKVMVSPKYNAVTKVSYDLHEH